MINEKEGKLHCLTEGVKNAFCVVMKRPTNVQQPGGLPQTLHRDGSSMANQGLWRESQENCKCDNVITIVHCCN